VVFPTLYPAALARAGVAPDRQPGSAAISLEIAVGVPVEEGDEQVIEGLEVALDEAGRYAALA
jgi:hypothetical protein